MARWTEMTVKVLHVSTSDLSGGAARAAYRLVCGLRDRGSSVGLLVSDRTGDDRDCFTPRRSFSERMALRCRLRLESWALNRYRHSPAYPWSSNLLPDSALLRSIHQFSPDLIHLHWIGGSHLPIPNLAGIDRPLVWTLHDMWPFTGGCHYTGDCPGFKSCCGSCPQLASESPYDLSRWVWLAKNRYWRNLNLTAVAPSRWMADQAKSSSLFSKSRVEVIPNGVDTAVYKPADRNFARDVFGLPRDGTFLLFGAVRACDDERKGYVELQRALGFLDRFDKNPELIVFGASGPGDSQDIPVPTRFVGHLNDDISLSLLYSACDVFVAPSRQEAFSLVILEALACGLPVVAFDGTGPRDLIDHLENGYLAQPISPEDLANGINWVLQDPQRYLALRSAARRKAEDEFSIDRVSQLHTDLYRSILTKA
ncbi:MAG: glycosyltransferase [Methylococcaceae bacterium]|nr:glycosyltransferase [Methylococcaceae bacterium]